MGIRSGFSRVSNQQLSDLHSMEAWARQHLRREISLSRSLQIKLAQPHTTTKSQEIVTQPISDKCTPFPASSEFLLFNQALWLQCKCWFCYVASLSLKQGECQGSFNNNNKGQTKMHVGVILKRAVAAKHQRQSWWMRATVYRHKIKLPITHWLSLFMKHLFSNSEASLLLRDWFSCS